MFDRILVALDDLADRHVVSPYLRFFARAVSPRVIVMKTVPFLETIVEMPHELSPDIEGDVEAMDVYVTAFVELLRSEGISAEGFTNVGRSGLSIAAAAERVDASLIVVTARSRSQVQTLLHATPIPVWIAPTQTPMTVGNILLPFDRDASLETLPTAAFLARTLRTNVIILEVVDSCLVPVSELVRNSIASPQIVIRRGDAVTEILRASRELGIGAIVARDGSVARELLGRASVPLLIDRPRARPEAAPDRVPERLSVPVDLWTRRTPANPLRGAGDIE